MWLQRDYLYKIQKTLDKVLVGENPSELIGALEAQVSNEQVLNLIWQIEKIYKKQTKLEEILKSISDGNYHGIVSESGFAEVNVASLSKIQDTFRELDEVTRAISLGDFTKKLKKKSEKDVIADSVNAILDTFVESIRYIDDISDGRYDIELKPKSDKDLVGKAIVSLAENLKILKSYNTNQNWIKSSLNQLSEELTGDRSQIDVSNMAISFISKAVNAGVGAIYLNEKNELRLTATYAYMTRDSISSVFRMREGIVGQVAFEKKPILLKNIKREDCTINTAVVSEPPLCTFTLPLIYEESLYGVIELGSFELFSEEKVEFLEQAVKIVATYLFASKQREDVKLLLKVSDDANFRLTKQGEILQEANAQLEEQQQQLQQQSEELQQSNAQLEELQQQLQQQLEELQSNNEELNRGRQELDKKNAELIESSNYKSQFLANVSHELRTPLNSIILLSKMLAMNHGGRLDDEEVKKSSIIYESGNELLRLINDILDLSKAENKSMAVKAMKLQTDEIISHVKDIFSEQAAEKSIEFICFDHYVGSITTDRDKFFQILRNIIGNAVKFTKDGKVEVSIEHSDLSETPLKISVKDSGIGIPDDKIEHIFEPFRQVDGSISREFGGTGLGLAIVKEHATKLGIQIKVYSRLGEGSTFELLIPNLDSNSHTIKEQASSVGVSKMVLSNRYFLIMSSNVSLQEKISHVNIKKGYETLVYSPNNIRNEVLCSNPPAAIIVDSTSTESFATSLKDLKSFKEMQSVPVYVVENSTSDDSEKINKYIEFINREIGSDSKNRVYIYKDRSSKMEGMLRDAGFNIVNVSTFDELKIKVSNKDSSKIVITSKELLLNEACAIHSALSIAEIIAVLDSPLSEDEENSLKGCVAAIVVESEMSDARVLNELNATHMPTISHRLQNAKTDLVSNISLDTKTILVADDDVKNIYVLTSLLESKGANIVQAFDGKSAIKKLSENHVDLILMDIMMPIMNGFEAIKEIKSNKKYEHIPIITVTAKALKEDLDKALEAGSDDFITKPVDYNVLVSMVDAWIKKTSKDAASKGE